MQVGFVAGGLKLASSQHPKLLAVPHAVKLQGIVAFVHEIALARPIPNLCSHIAQQLLIIIFPKPRSSFFYRYYVTAQLSGEVCAVNLRQRPGLAYPNSFKTIIE